MQHLTRDQRDVIGLRFLAGLTSREVGQILNKKDGAVREMQRAAIEKLRELLVES
jgi:RNA polymerase sigma-70 factor (ECF subfamily)